MIRVLATAAWLPAVEHWLYEPGTRDGEAADFAIDIVVEFEIR